MIALRQTDEDLLEYGSGIERRDLENAEYPDPTHRKVDRTNFAQELQNRSLSSGISRSDPVLTPQHSVLINWLKSSVNPTQGVSKVEVARREIVNRVLQIQDLEALEIEAFRNVRLHLMAEDIQKLSEVALQCLGRMDEISPNFIYKYPHIPQFLASRLAKANIQRIATLSRLRFANQLLRCDLKWYVRYMG